MVKLVVMAHHCGFHGFELAVYILYIPGTYIPGIQFVAWDNSVYCKAKFNLIS